MRTLKISFTVDEGAAGSVLADLADRVNNLDFNVIEEVPHNKNKPRQVKTNGGATVADTIAATLQDGPKTFADLRQALIKRGFSAGSVNGRLYQMLGDKRVKRAGFNQYVLVGDK